MRDEFMKNEGWKLDARICSVWGSLELTAAERLVLKDALNIHLYDSEHGTLGPPSAEGERRRRVLIADILAKLGS